ncbi:hypothetical protein HYDPIDRAFT_109934 [Hydnomerulius pinastri MD-312]|nr:hypothetical protein HYDPIDRAFT_109934 [Hydnomerulius pinastri MD-312]
MGDLNHSFPQHAADTRFVCPTTSYPPAAPGSNTHPLNLNFTYPNSTFRLALPNQLAPLPRLALNLNYGHPGMPTLPIREYWELRREVDLEALAIQAQTRTQAPVNFGANTAINNGLSTRDSSEMERMKQPEVAESRSRPAGMERSMATVPVLTMTGSGSVADPIVLEDDSDSPNSPPTPDAEPPVVPSLAADPSPVQALNSALNPAAGSQSQSQPSNGAPSSISDHQVPPKPLSITIPPILSSTRSKPLLIARPRTRSPNSKAPSDPAKSLNLLPRHTRKLFRLAQYMGWFRSFGSKKLAYPHEGEDPQIGDVYMHVYRPLLDDDGASTAHHEDKKKTQLWVRKRKRGIVQWSSGDGSLCWMRAENRIGYYARRWWRGEEHGKVI